MRLKNHVFNRLFGVPGQAKKGTWIGLTAERLYAHSAYKTIYILILPRAKTSQQQRKIRFYPLNLLYLDYYTLLP